MQLVGPTVGMYDPMKIAIGIPEVVEKWGVPPESDRPAGADRRLGRQCPASRHRPAAQLLEQFGDLETLLARAGDQDKRRESIIATDRRVLTPIATLKNDVPVKAGSTISCWFLTDWVDPSQDNGVLSLTRRGGSMEPGQRCQAAAVTIERADGLCPDGGLIAPPLAADHLLSGGRLANRRHRSCRSPP